LEDDWATASTGRCHFRQGCYEVRMTPAQCRAARGLIKWTQHELAAAAKADIAAIRNLEDERSLPPSATIDLLQRTLEANGVEFIAENGGGLGVRLKRPSVNEGLRPEDLNASNDE
jgi:transcriptional regulator with XRE-family HTH domain